MNGSTGGSQTALSSARSAGLPPGLSPGYTRRDFLGLLTGLAFGVNVFFAVATLLKMLEAPTRSLDGRVRLGWRTVARASLVSAEKPTLVQYGEDWVYLTRVDGSVVGLNAACPHVRCKLAWDPTAREYRCPCHKSGFDIAGRKLYGPAFRDMFPMMVKVEGGKVLVGGRAEDQV